MKDEDRDLDGDECRGPFGGPEDREPAPSAPSPEDVGSLLDKAKSWFLSGFERALDDRSKTRGTRLVFDDGSIEPENEGVVAQARWLLVAMLRFAACPFVLAIDVLEEHALRELPDTEAIREDPRKFVLGLGNDMVAGGSSFNVRIQPQVSFQPERLFIPAPVAQHFVVNDIKVGKNSQIIGSGAISAMAFSDADMDASDRLGLRLDPCPLGKEIVISVTNIDQVQQHAFQGAIFGTAM